jgi:hypothetical protein
LYTCVPCAGAWCSTKSRPKSRMQLRLSWAMLPMPSRPQQDRRSDSLIGLNGSRNRAVIALDDGTHSRHRRGRWWWGCRVHRCRQAVANGGTSLGSLRGRQPDYSVRGSSLSRAPCKPPGFIGRANPASEIRLMCSRGGGERNPEDRAWGQGVARHGAASWAMGN